MIVVPGSVNADLLFKIEFAVVDLGQHGHRDRQFIDALHRKLLVKIKRNRFAGFEDFCSDADTSLRHRSDSFDLVSQFSMLVRSRFCLLGGGGAVRRHSSLLSGGGIA